MGEGTLFGSFLNDGFPIIKKAGPDFKWDSFPFGPSPEFGTLVPSPQTRLKHINYKLVSPG